MTAGVWLGLGLACLFGIGTFIFAITTAPRNRDVRDPHDPGQREGGRR